MNIINIIPCRETKDKQKKFNMNITQEERVILKTLILGPTNEVIANRFTGAEVELCPEAVALYDLIIGCEMSLNIFGSLFMTAKDRDETDLVFKTAIDVFRRNWPQEYIILLN